MKPSEFYIKKCGCIIGKAIETLGFHKTTHLLDQSSINVSSRGVFRTRRGNVFRKPLTTFSRQLFS